MWEDKNRWVLLPVQGPLPLMGEHTREILRGIGFNEKNIERLYASAVK
jgi:crotonobetainyl-CoA:carnitine CoA-transferase CaiB-like acyl-CoA transferase